MVCFGYILADVALLNTAGIRKRTQARADDVEPRDERSWAWLVRRARVMARSASASVESRTDVGTCGFLNVIVPENKVSSLKYAAFRPGRKTVRFDSKVLKHSA